MEIVIVTQSFYVRNQFVNTFYPRGVTVYHTDNADQLLEKLRLYPNIEFVFIDVIHEEFAQALDILAKVKAFAVTQKRTIYALLIYVVIDKTIAAKAIENGCVGFVKSNVSGDELFLYTLQLYQKLRGAPPQRKYVRISFDPANPNERIGIKFRSPINSQLLVGVIRDISFGGLAVELVGMFPQEALSVNVQISNIQFMLDDRDVYADATVVAYDYRKRFCALRFTYLSSEDQEVLASFIFKRVALGGVLENSIEKSEEKTQQAPENTEDQSGT
ncbi:PilZ domain-containing protein [Thermospira aquatica]|uniref:PilZ domain-containing protein n=1 Tax=Thermospira aquatica TaxID=2828656 RepID=A0AAX3BCE8_9SPIR|nr:PilZ domain-containing protein [Thermospira aquatica]URA09952.1 PilZ domain-containing protein [Thermospira aquatica]